MATLRCLPSSPPAAPGLPLPSGWPESPALAVPEGLVGPAGLLGSVEFPAPAGLSILAGLSEPADLPGSVGTGESPASTELASVSAGSDLSILDRLIGVTGRSECSVSARCGVMGWRPGAATLEPTTRLELLLGPLAAMCSLGAFRAGVGTGCDAWRLATMDCVAAGALNTIGFGWIRVAGPGAAARPGPGSWLKTGEGLLASGATSPSLTMAVIPRIPPPASATQAATAALVARVWGGSGAAIPRRWLAVTRRKWGSTPIHAIKAFAGGPDPALRRCRAVSSFTWVSACVNPTSPTLIRPVDFETAARSCR